MSESLISKEGLKTFGIVWGFDREIMMTEDGWKHCTYSSSGHPIIDLLDEVKPNPLNSNITQFYPTKDVGLIFPSWLMHYVPPAINNRISMSWNILLRGEYGEPDTLQNASI